jgi:hypothetical protein
MVPLYTTVYNCTARTNLLCYTIWSGLFGHHRATCINYRITATLVIVYIFGLCLIVIIYAMPVLLRYADKMLLGLKR